MPEALAAERAPHRVATVQDPAVPAQQAPARALVRDEAQDAGAPAVEPGDEWAVRLGPSLTSLRHARGR